MCQEIFAKLPLRPETRRVFENAVTGKLTAGTHGWDKEHRAYNKPLKVFSTRFSSKKISPMLI